jgi:hypothetical protein
MRMRFHTTIRHGERLQAWRDAYAIHDRFAEAGDDGVAHGGTVEADAADKALDEALDAFLLTPPSRPRKSPVRLRSSPSVTN